MARYAAEGEAAFEPRSRRPTHTPNATPPETLALVVDLRASLLARGLDAGHETLAWHLSHHHDLTLSRATIHRILTRAGLITPEPKKRSRSSYLRFQADQPNECWQSDFTRYGLPRRATPGAVYATGIKAAPSTDRTQDSHDRVRTDRVGTTGTITLRVAGKLRHLAVGRAHAGTHVKVLIHDLEATVIHATTGEILSEITLDLTRNYQPQHQKD